ncbi:MAG: Ig-like domain-containing protein [Clostridia bacterium]|nr:Ig-like domain-containing protein [Clostridia bacterium]
MKNPFRFLRKLLALMACVTMLPGGSFAAVAAFADSSFDAGVDTELAADGWGEGSIPPEDGADPENSGIPEGEKTPGDGSAFPDGDGETQTAGGMPAGDGLPAEDGDGGPAELNADDGITNPPFLPPVWNTDGLAVKVDEHGECIIDLRAFCSLESGGEVVFQILEESKESRGEAYWLGGVGPILAYRHGADHHLPAGTATESDAITVAAQSHSGGLPWGDSVPVEIPVTITYVNDAPAFVSQGEMPGEAPPVFTIDEGTFHEMDLTKIAYDADHSYAQLTFSLVPGMGPSFGMVTFPGNGTDSPMLKYIPHKGYHGEDSFAVTVTDAQGASAAVHYDVAMVINKLHSPVTLRDEEFVIQKQFPSSAVEAVSLDVLKGAACPDTADGYVIKIDPDSLTAPTLTGADGSPGAAVLAANGARINYTPPYNTSGTDTFEYTVTRAGVKSRAVVTIRIPIENKAPVITGLADDFFPEHCDPGDAKEHRYPIQIVDDATPYDALGVQVFAYRNGSLLEDCSVTSLDEEGNCSILVTPKRHASGEVQLRLRVSDGFRVTEDSFTLHIAPADHGPAAKDFTLTTRENEPITFKLADADRVELINTLFSDVVFDIPLVNGFLREAANPAGAASLGTLAKEPGAEEYTFTPAPDTWGEIQVGFTVTCGGLTDTGICTIRVDHVNHPPVVEEILPGLQPLHIPGDRISGPFEVNYSDRDTRDEDLIVLTSSGMKEIIDDTGLWVEEDSLTGEKRLWIKPQAYAKWEPTDGPPIALTLLVSDGELYTAKTLEVYVDPVEHRPFAFPVEYRAYGGVPIFLNPLDNDYDVDGDALYAYIDMDAVNALGRGVLEGIGEAAEVKDGMGGICAAFESFLYTPPHGFEGDVVIHYRALDGNDHTGEPSHANESTITICVERRDAPLAVARIPDYVQTVSKVADQSFSHAVEVLNIPQNVPCNLSVKAVSDNAGLLTNVTLGSPGQSAVWLAGGGNRPQASQVNFTIAKGQEGVGFITINAKVQEFGREPVQETITFRVTAVSPVKPPDAKDYTVDVPCGESYTFQVVSDAADSVIPKNVRIACMGSQADPASGKSDLGRGILTMDPARGEIAYHAVGEGSADHAAQPDSFTYTLINGGGLTATATVHVMIVDPEQPLAAEDDLYIFPISAAGSTGVPLSPGVTENDRDPDGGDQSWRIHDFEDQNHPPLGVSVQDNTNFLVNLPGTPGVYMFRYRIRSQRPDNGVRKVSNWATVTLVIYDDRAGVGDAPCIVESRTLRMTEDVPATFDLTPYIHASAANLSGTLTFAPVNTPENMLAYSALVDTRSQVPASGLTAPAVTALPAPDSLYTLTVNPKPDASGTVELWYTVNNGYGRSEYGGVDSDGVPLAATGKLTVVIEPVNKPPVISLENHYAGDTLLIGSGETFTFKVTTTDTDNAFDELYLAVVSGTGLVEDGIDTGDLIVNTNQIRVERGDDPDWYVTITGLNRGRTTLGFLCGDGMLQTRLDVEVRVTGSSKPLLLLDGARADIPEHTAAGFDVVTQANNPNNALLNVTILNAYLSGPSHAGNPSIDSGEGSVEVLGNRRITFTPAPRFFHEDAEDVVVIEYRIEVDGDPDVASDAGTLLVHVIPVNDPPEIYGLNAEYSTDRNQSFRISFFVRDVDRGYVVGEDGVVTNPGGPDITAAVMGTGVLAPDFRDHVISPVIVESIGTERDHVYACTAEVVPARGASHPGLLDRTRIQFTAAEKNGGEQSAATCGVYIKPVNLPPVRADGEAGTVFFRAIKEGETFEEEITRLFADPEGNDIILLSVAPVSHYVSASNIGGGVLRYVPEAHFSTGDGAEWPADPEAFGAVSFTVSDGEGGYFTGTVIFEIEHVSRPPEAYDATYPAAMNAVNEYKEYGIKLVGAVHGADVNKKGEALRFTILSPVSNGRLIYRDMSGEGSAGFPGEVNPNPWADGFDVRYIPDEDFCGEDSFTFSVADSSGNLSDTAGTVTFDVKPVNQPPYISFEDGSGAWHFNKKQPDPVVWVMGKRTGPSSPPGIFGFNVWDELPGAVIEISVPDGSALLPNPACYGIEKRGNYLSVFIKPEENQTGSVALTFTATDALGAARRRTVTLVVSPYNTPPVPKKASVEHVFPANATLGPVRFTAADAETGPADLRYVLVDPADGLEKVTPYRNGLGVFTLSQPAAGGANAQYDFAPADGAFGTYHYILRIYDRGDPDGSYNLADPSSWASVSPDVNAWPKYVDVPVKITVTPVNRAPAAPADVSLDWDSGSDDGRRVTVTWSKSADPETPESLLEYSVEYSAAGLSGPWVVVNDGVSGETERTRSLTFTAPAGCDADRFAVRVMARDDARFGKDYMERAANPFYDMDKDGGRIRRASGYGYGYGSARPGKKVGVNPGGPNRPVP